MHLNDGVMRYDDKDDDLEPRFLVHDRCIEREEAWAVDG